MNDRDRPRIAVSSCLLGVPVRYDGGHRKSSYLVDELGPRVEWVRVCPEVEIGLGTPRDPIDLEETLDPRRPRLVQGERELTRRMRSYALGRIEELRARRIDGYVLKARSPSCGLAGVKLSRRDGRIERVGRGIFAQALLETWPELPAFEETDLTHPQLAQSRVDWIFTMFAFGRRGPGLEGIVEFHRSQQTRLSAVDPVAAAELAGLLGIAPGTSTGAAAGGSTSTDVSALALRYARILSAALSRPPR